MGLYSRYGVEVSFAHCKRDRLEEVVICHGW